MRFELEVNAATTTQALAIHNDFVERRPHPGRRYRPDGAWRQRGARANFARLNTGGGNDGTGGFVTQAPATRLSDSGWYRCSGCWRDGSPRSSHYAAADHDFAVSGERSA